MTDVLNSDEEIAEVDAMSVEEIRQHVETPNRCWSDTYCDCVQQHATERMLKHYDALAAKYAAAERDAARYRWLRSRAEDYDGAASFPCVDYPCPIPDAVPFNRIDDAIDAAMQLHAGGSEAL